MSETVHIVGSLKPTNKTVEEYVGDVEIPDYYDSVTDFFHGRYYSEAIEIDGLVYEIISDRLDPHGDIFNASLNENKSIDFEVRYYNGGCSFTTALQSALENLKEK